MAKRASRPDTPADECAPAARRTPQQARSRERFERILGVAEALIAEKGSDAMRMSEVVERAGVSFGSLYQYFPDKAAIIATLAERYNAEGHACVAEILAEVRAKKDLAPAVGRIVDGFHRMYLDYPAMRDIWRATQGDKALQAIDAADFEAHAQMLLDVLARLAPTRDSRALATVARLMTELIAAAVRAAVAADAEEGARIIAAFKRMLPKDLTALAD